MKINRRVHTKVNCTSANSENMSRQKCVHMDARHEAAATITLNLELIILSYWRVQKCPRTHFACITALAVANQIILVFAPLSILYSSTFSLLKCIPESVLSMMQRVTGTKTEQEIGSRQKSHAKRLTSHLNIVCRWLTMNVSYVWIIHNGVKSLWKYHICYSQALTVQVSHTNISCHG